MKIIFFILLLTNSIYAAKFSHGGTSGGAGGYPIKDCFTSSSCGLSFINANDNEIEIIREYCDKSNLPEKQFSTKPQIDPDEDDLNCICYYFQYDVFFVPNGDFDTLDFNQCLFNGAKTLEGKLEGMIEFEFEDK